MNYIEEHQLGSDASALNEEDCCNIIHDFLSHHGSEMLIRQLPVRMTFGKAMTVPFNGDPYLFTLTYAKGGVTATLEANSNTS